MRTIKFRGKSLATGEWLYGSHFNDGAEDYILPPHPSGAIDYEDYQVDQNTVGQFTGLCDKNGKEIYEGDIIQGEYEYKHLIRYTEEDARFTATLVDCVGDKISERCNAGDVTQKWINEFNKVVIGNALDNPELINKKRL